MRLVEKELLDREYGSICLRSYAMNTIITREQIKVNQRVSHTAEVFGVHFPMQFEPYVYSVTERLTCEYDGGYWQFYALSNGGFYMAPDPDKLFFVSCENGYEGNLSADALGISACLYAYSQLSFSDSHGFAEICTEQYHWLREYMLEHPEAGDILGAID